MRKLFPCGHRGRGQYCHRCDEKQSAIRDREDARRAQQALADLLGVAVGAFPGRILRRAATIHQQVLAGGLPALRAVGAKKILCTNGGVLSVPLGRRYRLLFAVEHDHPRCLGLLTHSDYNTRVERV